MRNQQRNIDYSQPYLANQVPQYPNPYNIRYPDQNQSQHNLSNVLSKNKMNLSSQNYLNQHQQAERIRIQSQQRKKKISKITIIVIFVCIFLVIIIPIIIVITIVSHRDPFGYTLEPGYSFTGNKNCYKNFTISIYWPAYYQDYDLYIQQPNGGKVVNFFNRIGIYGNHSGDVTQEFGPQSYVAVCAVTGQFQIKIDRRTSSVSANTVQLKIIIHSLLGNEEDLILNKDITVVQQNNNPKLFAILVISQYPQLQKWNFQLV